VGAGGARGGGGGGGGRRGGAECSLAVTPPAPSTTFSSPDISEEAICRKGTKPNTPDDKGLKLPNGKAADFRGRVKNTTDNKPKLSETLTPRRAAPRSKPTLRKLKITKPLCRG